jgi:hypothetical protein
MESSPIELPGGYEQHNCQEVQLFAIPNPDALDRDAFCTALHSENKKYRLSGSSKYHPKNDFKKYMEVISEKICKKFKCASSGRPFII